MPDGSPAIGRALEAADERKDQADVEGATARLEENEKAIQQGLDALEGR